MKSTGLKAAELFAVKYSDLKAIESFAVKYSGLKAIESFAVKYSGLKAALPGKRAAERKKRQSATFQ
jgi:hypothetical protein